MIVCLSFYSCPFLFAALIDLLLDLLALKKLLSVIKTGNFYHGVTTCSGRKFCSEFFIQLFEHSFVPISGPITPITLIWVLFERSFPLAAVEYRQSQFWSKKGEGLSWEVMIGTRVKGLKISPYTVHHDLHLH